MALNNIFSNFTLKDLNIEYPIIQGGMGIGISSAELSGTVSKYGGLGVLSSVALDYLISQKFNKHFKQREAVKIEIEEARKISGQKPLGINIMVAIQKHYKDSVLGALDGGVDVIISGAGLPLQLPEIVAEHERVNEVKLIPIVSSARAFELICKRWQRSNRLPDAVVVEGPLAGGHIGWRDVEEAYKPENRLEVLVKDVLKAAEPYQIPVIAAGGIYTHEDILQYLEMGCKAVQMGTRFLATIESGATNQYKEAVVNCKEEDIILSTQPGSPCGLLFRVLKESPFYQESLAGERAELCNKGYLMINGKCLACQDRTLAFCICNGLLSAAGANEVEKELYTVGANAYKVEEIVSVKELMSELTNSRNLILS